MASHPSASAGRRRRNQDTTADGGTAGPAPALAYAGPHRPRVAGRQRVSAGPTGWTGGGPRRQGSRQMIDDIRRIAADAVARLAGAATLDEVAALDRELLGKTSELSAFKRQMGGLDHEARRE